MKLRKKWILFASLSTPVIPLTTLVACGGSVDQPNKPKIGNKEITDLETQISDLTKQLQIEKQNATNTTGQSNAEVIDQLSKQINDLNDQLNNLSKTIEEVKTAPVQVEPVMEREQTMEEKEADFQSFRAIHQDDVKVLDFNDFKQIVNPDVQWQRGVPGFALAQGGSYIYNLALKLGYQKQLQNIQNLALKTPDASDELNKDRNDVFDKLKTIFDNVRQETDANKTKLLASQDYQRFNFNTSNGGHLSQQRLLIAGLDISAFGSASAPTGLIAKGKMSNTAFDYENFKFTSSDGQENVLIGENNKLKGMKYWSADVPGANVVRIDVPATYKQDSNGKATQIALSTAFSKEYVIEGVQPTYPKEIEVDREHNLIVLEGMLRKLDVLFSKENEESINQLKAIADLFGVSKEFIGALEFLGKNFDKQNGFKMTQVGQAYDSLNNGSHYFKAVETFIRGIKGISFKNASKEGVLPTTPQPGDVDYAHDGIINASQDHLEVTLDAWSVQQGKGVYTFGKDKLVVEPIKNF